LPVSTAPPKPGREERKRPHTKKYQESRAMDEIAEIEICDTKGVYTKPTVTSSYVSIDSCPMLEVPANWWGCHTNDRYPYITAEVVCPVKGVLRGVSAYVPV